jgi:hypothetical protein
LIGLFGTFRCYVPFFGDRANSKPTTRNEQKKVKPMPRYLILTFWVGTTLGCGAGKNNEPKTFTVQTKTASDTLYKTVVIPEASFNQVDTPITEYLIARLKPIRANFKRINSITNWTSTEKKELWETLEGGEATFYYLDGRLEKIIARNFGETFQKLNEYYLLNGYLSFVFEKSYKYNRPMYYDSTAMKENNDTEIFDFDKSEIKEDRSYFENKRLIYQLNNQDYGSPLADDYLQGEQKRILTNFEKLMKLTNLEKK